jgi:hypothetical protein
MKRRFLTVLQEKIAHLSKQPWATFETNGIDRQTGQVGFSISWNPAFIKNLHAAGFQGTTDEETIQLFFLSTRMFPDDLGNGDVVNPAATPNLTNEANRFVK